ncbi:MAG TPA: monovalent cation/H+ antiporter complex subunit F [Candidatus Dormibacteraeota bacterium]|nr:monovalent cation/H+ antiporter complex subunit F [Candidatus Dormibacteraeota bacterium]
MAATALVVALGPCLALCMVGKPLDGLVALELAGVLTTVALLLLAEGFHRQSFADLALVFMVLNFGGGLAFARMMERRL